MSLIKSLAVTALIFITVWGVLIWKNAPLTFNLATSPEMSIATSANNESPSFLPPTITLVGLKKTVDLSNTNDINEHWQSFYNFNDLHSSVSDTTSAKVYGYYRPLDNSFTRAELTVGYNNQNQSLTGFNVLETLDIQNFETVMENSKSWDTTPAWNAIDNNRMVVAVLEEYVIDMSGGVTATNVYVHYK